MVTPHSGREDLAHMLRGLLMGGADIIPGVSGGTVALILGIYTRLVTAISHVDLRLLQLLRRRQWRRASAHIDLRFLFALAVGIAIGIVGLASLMHYLLETYRAPTMAAFFGLILGSSWLVGRAVTPQSGGQLWICWAIGIVGVAVGLAIALQQATGTRPGHGYTFASGAVAICAMILPGISGAHILLLLGKYAEITGIIKKIPSMEINGDELTTLCVFAAGCALGLILFSKLLRWLLSRWQAPTMALLCGFMIGSLYRVWPLQQDVTPEITDLKHKMFRPMLPASFNSEAVACLLIALAATAAVLLLERWAARSRHTS